MKINWTSILQKTRLAKILGVLLILIYILVTVFSAFTSPIIMDESAYILDGYLFANQVYEPFESGGPYLNKMPLTYLMYGWAGQIVGDIFIAGRLLAMIASSLIVVGL